MKVLYPAFSVVLDYLLICLLFAIIALLVIGTMEWLVGQAYSQGQSIGELIGRDGETPKSTT